MLELESEFRNRNKGKMWFHKLSLSTSMFRSALPYLLSYFVLLFSSASSNPGIEHLTSETIRRHERILIILGFRFNKCQKQEKHSLYAGRCRSQCQLTVIIL